MPSSLITFRSQTSTHIDDLLADEGLTCVPSRSIVSYLAGNLLNYKEEGREYTPTILFCEDSDAVIKAFPGSVKYIIGTIALDADAGRRILKECVPLAVGQWCIFIERNGTKLHYGVFSYLNLPTTLPLEEVISISSTTFSILLRKISSNTVELRGSKGNSLSMIFSTVREKTVDENPVAHFANDCCETLPSNPLLVPFQNYFHSLLSRTLNQSHGTILACVPQNLKAIREFRDHVALNPILDFHSVFREYREDQSAQSIVKLQSYEELFLGIVSSDGIVAFNTAGCLIGYRVFFRPMKKQKQDSTISGGARRRAFEGAKALVGDHLCSLLFRSQDGLTIHHGTTND
jgi:hypothetical protein